MSNFAEKIKRRAWGGFFGLAVNRNYNKIARELTVPMWRPFNPRNVKSNLRRIIQNASELDRAFKIINSIEKLRPNLIIKSQNLPPMGQKPPTPVMYTPVKPRANIPVPRANIENLLKRRNEAQKKYRNSFQYMHSPRNRYKFNRAERNYHTAANELKKALNELGVKNRNKIRSRLKQTAREYRRPKYVNGVLHI
jgi:hypothetical protein